MEILVQQRHLRQKILRQPLRKAQGLHPHRHPTRRKGVGRLRHARQVRRRRRRASPQGRLPTRRVSLVGAVGSQEWLARQWHLPRRGIQEARIRSDRRCAERSRRARRNRYRQSDSEILFRRRGDGRESEVQSVAQRTLGCMVPDRSLGLALRQWVLVVRLRLQLVSRLATLGLQAALLSVVGLATDA